MFGVYVKALIDFKAFYFFGSVSFRFGVYVKWPLITCGGKIKPSDPNAYPGNSIKSLKSPVFHLKSHINWSRACIFFICFLIQCIGLYIFPPLHADGRS